MKTEQRIIAASSIPPWPTRSAHRREARDEGCRSVGGEISVGVLKFRRNCTRRVLGGRVSRRSPSDRHRSAQPFPAPPAGRSARATGEPEPTTLREASGPAARRIPPTGSGVNTPTRRHPLRDDVVGVLESFPDVTPGNWPVFEDLQCVDAARADLNFMSSSLAVPGASSGRRVPPGEPGGEVGEQRIERCRDEHLERQTAASLRSDSGRTGRAREAPASDSQCGVDLRLSCRP